MLTSAEQPRLSFQQTAHLLRYLYAQWLLGFYRIVGSASTQGHFPLNDCTEVNIDMVSLLENDVDQTWVQQQSLMVYVSWELKLMNSDKQNSMWMGATVIDQFSADTETINFSNWSFHAWSHSRVPYMKSDIEPLEISTKDVNDVLELKIQFVERLFKELNGVRNNSVHVGVVFLDGTSLTQEDMRNVPSIVQQLHAEVKIFVVLFGNKLVEEIVHLTDTLVLPNMVINNFGQYLLLAMCKKCGRKWFLFEHKTSLNMFSCFRLFNYSRTWNRAMSYYSRVYNSHLAGIETVEEMTFIKEQMCVKLKQMKMYTANIMIGLRRDMSNYAKRFQWMTTPGKYHPMVIPHWPPGKPCRGCINADCGVWQFTIHRKNNKRSKNVLQNITCDGDAAREALQYVNCDSENTRFQLCETVLPRRINDTYFIRSIPVTPESINYTLNKGHFVIYETNIVSVSANVANRNFLQFLRDSDMHFPIFDCGEDAGDRRYISYSMVCDFVDHCSNKRDELLCSNPRELLEDNKMYCTSGHKLPSPEYKCDNVKNCKDGSDEENCKGDNCKSVRCIDGSCLPTQWLNDGEFDCFIYTDNSSDFLANDESTFAKRYLQKSKTCALTCNHHTCIDEHLLRDGAINCTDPERLLYETIGQLEPANSCINTLGDYIWAPKCHYTKDRYDGIIGCRDMSHLRDCENFQCAQGYVKCYNSYCIHNHYILDGRADCPTSEDEQLFHTGPCTGYFACWDSNICRHPDLVCNGYPDCPHGDDEFDCREFCPEGFRCIAGTVVLSDYNRSVPLNMSRLSGIGSRTRYLDLSGVELYGFDKFMSGNVEVALNLKVLILSKCNISQLYVPKLYFPNDKGTPYMIENLDISCNRFEHFSKLDYSKFYKNIHSLNMSYNKQLKSVRNLRFSSLEMLDLSYTNLSYLRNSVFAHLHRLKHLNLSHTLISYFTRQYFGTKFTLQTLDLRGILTKDIHDYLFHDLTISQTLYTDHVQMCCPKMQGLIKAHACIAPVDADIISSCYDLVGLSVQRVLLWIVAILAVLGNITVIVYRAIWDRSVFKTGYGLFVTNLGISDFIMGVYLFIIAGADYFYRDNYVLYDKSWRNSDVCKIAGFMACLSCEASTFFVFLITLDRFLVMKFPFGQINLSKFLKTITVMISWVASFLLSLVPIVFSFDMYSSNAMCIGLPLTNTQAKGRVYSVGIFIIFNLIMFLFIAYGQYAIFRAISVNRISKTATSMPPSRRAEDITVAKQLSLVVMSNFLFWFPVGLVGLLSLGGQEISNEVYAWTTVLLLPINSAANPVLYTIPALMARWKNFKLGDQRMLSHSV